MSQLGIFGSGFGLYGYLPALISCGQQVLLPQRYFARFKTRPELSIFEDQVKWVADEQQMLERVNGAVIALEPRLQEYWLPQCLSRRNIDSLFLEKPLARTPEIAAILFDNLRSSGKNFRIGYIFRYTSWGKKILSGLISNWNLKELSIQWFFNAHHFQNNLKTWKRTQTMGGGVIRFYGIQIIALLAEIGYRDVVLSQTTGPTEDECERWKATFVGNELPECDVLIDTKCSVSKFQIVNNFESTKYNEITDLSNPFELDNGPSSSTDLDNRVSLLGQLCKTLWKQDTNEYAWYLETIRLWLAVEHQTVFERK